MLPLVFEREIIWPKLAKIQPYLFGIGAAGISLFMMGAGTLGVPRRHWDITFSDANLSFAHSAGAFLMMGLNGVFAIIAAIGGSHLHTGRRRHGVVRREDQEPVTS